MFQEVIDGTDGMTTSIQHNAIINDLTVQHRFREDFIKERVALENRIGAAKRRLKSWDRDPNEVIIHMPVMSEVLEPLSKAEKEKAKVMEKLVKDLPHYDWAMTIRGLGPLSYAQILAELNSPLLYPNPAKVWKWMGLAVVNGEAHKNREKGVESKYCKRRRMVMYRIESNFVKSKGFFRDMYDRRKAYEVERDANGYNEEYIETHRRQLMYQFASSANRKRIANGNLPMDVLNKRATRVLSKELLRQIWAKWHGFEDELPIHG